MLYYCTYIFRCDLTDDHHIYRLSIGPQARRPSPWSVYVFGKTFLASTTGAIIRYLAQSLRLVGRRVPGSPNVPITSRTRGMSISPRCSLNAIYSITAHPLQHHARWRCVDAFARLVGPLSPNAAATAAVMQTDDSSCWARPHHARFGRAGLPRAMQSWLSRRLPMPRSTLTLKIGEGDQMVDAW